MDIHIKVIRTKEITTNELTLIHELFDHAYHQANHSYLEKSFSTLRYIALATLEKSLIGFAVADTIESSIPRLADPQIVMLAGICCVNSNYRRLGLFTKLELQAASASNLLKPGVGVLACGRMAHPASFRTMSQSPATIPKYGVPLSDWHKEVGLKIAKLYDVNIDSETLIVIGKGTPSGYPKITYDATEEEKLLFKDVDRDRGDSLLGITWFPDAPVGW
ncbi:MAG: hypothetical protein MUP22_01205 [Desulfobacterales bacterium]|nr:hypothetical protein [Desulfobacterales bacterium]